MTLEIVEEGGPAKLQAMRLDDYASNGAAMDRSKG